MTNNTIPATAPALVITPEALLQHWQGHRQLTRRVIAAFPENELFRFSLGGMRPFAEMAIEMMDLASAGIEGMVTGQWQALSDLDHAKGMQDGLTKEALLQRWDTVTAQISARWPEIAPHRFQEVDLAFGQYQGPIYSLMLYWVDNEVHHRGQGYVYLRALGIEPPPFWDRY